MYLLCIFSTILNTNRIYFYDMKHNILKIYFFGKLNLYGNALIPPALCSLACIVFLHLSLQTKTDIITEPCISTYAIRLCSAYYREYIPYHTGSVLTTES